MKKIIFLNLLLVSVLAFSQTQNETAQGSSCVIEKDFKETKWTSTKVRTRNKTTLRDLKRKVSADTGTDVDKIILLSYTDKASSGQYLLCVNGEKIKYKRVSKVFSKN